MNAAGADYVIVDRLSKVYNEGTRQRVEAVAPSSFTVKAGEFVALLGPSGCGKSTLLMMIAGLDAPSAGRIEVAGRAMTAPRAETGIMFQDPTLLPWKSALDNVLFPFLAAQRQAANPPVDRAAALLDEVGLRGFHDHKPRQLSGGMRQRVAICRALVYEPDLLLMDEPFSALDAITRDEMNLVLMKMWQDHRHTALFVTHSIREAVYLADRVLVMSRRPGRIVEDIRIPFARPRGLEIGETVEFNKICGHLRGKIEHVPH
ncbi:MAG: ABC transporter ATP-binding protein [Alphaproteobacteria bacterium]|nr:ABC transporter ATP-binding protein [Alphaproteobacteria bacterium]